MGQGQVPKDPISSETTMCATSCQSQEPKDSISMETENVMLHVKGEENHKKERFFKEKIQKKDASKAKYLR